MCKFFLLQLLIRNELDFDVVLIADHVCLNSLIVVLAFVIVHESLVFKLLIVPKLINKLIKEDFILKVYIREQFPHFNRFLLR